VRSAESFADAFTAAFARLQVRIESACRGRPESERPARVTAAIRAALDFAAADPVAAQILTNEALAEGREGFARYDRMIAHFAADLRCGRELSPEGELLPELTEKMMIGGVASLIAQRLDAGRNAELPALAAEAIQFVLTPYLGTEEARRVAGA
jgi:hypothetical protein